MPRERALVRARPHIPETDSSINTSRCEGAAIRTERHASDIRGMPRERVLVRARHRIPETDFSRTPRCEGAAIWTERHA